MLCLCCNQETENPRFCSKSCSAKFNNFRRYRSDNSKAKTSATLKSKAANGVQLFGGKRGGWLPQTHITFRKCQICSKSFWAHGPNRYRQFNCSSECASTRRSMNKTLKTHIKSTEPVTGRKIDLQSSWEVSVAEKLNSLGIIWQRPSKRMKWYDGQTDRTYLPDFYLPKFDLYLDVKNKIGIEQQKRKIEEIQKQINLTVLELSPMLEYLARLAGVEPA